MKKLIEMTPFGFYCPEGDFYIDPWRPVPKAIVTHAHGDHCTWGCESYLVAKEGEALYRIRLGKEAVLQTVDYGEVISLGGVRVSLHPAGHVLGSAQIRIEDSLTGEVWVISGDYKDVADDTCAPLEVVACHHFITEATFGLPIYRWEEPRDILLEINNWWSDNAAIGQTSLLYCYALGKAQRILSGLDESIGPILTHGATEKLTQAYRQSGIPLPATRYAMVAEKSSFPTALVLAPVSARGSTWIRRFGTHSSGYTSGWMRIRGARRQKAVDRGFILSDHADWDGLLSVIKETGAQTIGVTHGYTEILSRYLSEKGWQAYPISTRFTGESEDSSDIEQTSEESLEESQEGDTDSNEKLQ